MINTSRSIVSRSPCKHRAFVFGALCFGLIFPSADMFGLQSYTMVKSITFRLGESRTDLTYKFERASV